MSEFVTAYEDEDFEAKLEQRDGVLFLHCEVFNYNKSVKKKMFEVFEDIKGACLFFGWDALHSYTPNPKFSKMFQGGEVISKIEHLGEQYEVIRWELSQL